jgi:signal transduction histidine kinase
VAIVRGEAEVSLSQIERSGAEYRESLAIVEDEGRRLTRIVEDLFTLARADAGQYPLAKTNLYLDDIIADCVRSIRSLAFKREVDVSYAQPAREMPFYGDEGLLRRMILNLLDNALKHTPAGGSIHLNLTQQDGTCAMTIADTGAGIPADAQPHIFERFYRADKARTRAGGENGSGAGLGLSIAQWVAEMHNGRIVLDHSDHNGSTFIISLQASSETST